MPETTTEPYYWPEEGIPSFESETGEDGTWVPLCDLHEGMVPLEYRPSAWGSWHCNACNVRHLIWAEDWPDAKEECEWAFEGTEHTDVDLHWWNCTTHDKTELGDSPTTKGYPDYCEEATA